MQANTINVVQLLVPNPGIILPHPSYENVITTAAFKPHPRRLKSLGRVMIQYQISLPLMQQCYKHHFSETNAMNTLGRYVWQSQHTQFFCSHFQTSPSKNTQIANDSCLPKKNTLNHREKLHSGWKIHFLHGWQYNTISPTPAQSETQVSQPTGVS